MKYNFLLVLSVSLFVSDICNASEAGTCGLKGTLQQRIQDCDKKFGALASKKIPVNDPFEPAAVYAWQLVTRTQERAQVWFDVTSSLVWADTATEDFTFQDSLKFCQGGKFGSDVKGQDQLSLTGKNRLVFNLPSKGELQAALAHGALEVLPNWRESEGIFWTASAGSTFSVCSSAYTPGYYTGSTHAITWVPGYHSYTCEPAAFMDVLIVKENKPTWNTRTLWFGDRGAVKCNARANE
jgi:hypothetical protein